MLTAARFTAANGGGNLRPLRADGQTERGLCGYQELGKGRRGVTAKWAKVSVLDHVQVWRMDRAMAAQQYECTLIPLKKVKMVNFNSLYKNKTKSTLQGPEGQI